MISFLRRSGFAFAAFVLAGCGGGGGGTTPALAAATIAPITGTGTGTATLPYSSRIVALDVSGTQTLGTFSGVPYVRSYGVLHGIIDPREAVVGLETMPQTAKGSYAYTSEYEIIAPAAGAAANHIVYVDAENRGTAASFSILESMANVGAPSTTTYPANLGNGFLPTHGISYARVQWQTAIAAGVPASAQGAGLAIVRDLGRLLGGKSLAVTASDGTTPATYANVILGGVSQSAWFVDDLIAEGFNVDPLTSAGVFNAAIAIDGAGNYLAINALGRRDGSPQMPYIEANAAPLAPNALLTRPASDPLFVDAAAYTDFYRLRAGLSDVAASSPKYVHYDWPAPHQSGPATVDAAAFPGGCNNGVPVALNPIDSAPYFRAIVAGVEHQLGVANAAVNAPLPPTTRFTLGPIDQSSAGFNALPGATVPVPQVDQNGEPLGGVRFPESDAPIGAPTPVSLPPVVTTSMNATCGNFGEFVPLNGAQLAALYGSRAAYLTRYDTSLQSLIASGYLLASDEAGMLSRAGSLYDTFAAQ